MTGGVAPSRTLRNLRRELPVTKTYAELTTTALPLQK